MKTTVWTLAIFIFIWNYVESVPPEACFANFRWDDCGYPPQAVLYYYKPGSRCEVGMWRGCLPNPNMFKDEYECVNTCIFSVRAQPEDYHNLNEQEIITSDNEISMGANATNATSTDKESTTLAGEGSGEGDNKATDSTGGGGDATEAGATVAADKAAGEPAGGKPAGGEPAGDKPAGDKPAGDKPAGDKPAGEEPAAGGGEGGSKKKR